MPRSSDPSEADLHESYRRADKLDSQRERPQRVRPHDGTRERLSVEFGRAFVYEDELATNRKAGAQALDEVRADREAANTTKGRILTAYDQLSDAGVLQSPVKL